MTDVELDARVTTLEENGGGGNSFNGKTNMSHSIRPYMPDRKLLECKCFVQNCKFHIYLFYVKTPLPSTQY